MDWGLKLEQKPLIYWKMKLGKTLECTGDLKIFRKEPGCTSNNTKNQQMKLHQFKKFCIAKKIPIY